MDLSAFYFKLWSEKGIFITIHLFLSALGADIVEKSCVFFRCSNPGPNTIGGVGRVLFYTRFRCLTYFINLILIYFYFIFYPLIEC